MKNPKLFCLVLFVFISHAVHAQSASCPDVKIGGVAKIEYGQTFSRTTVEILNSIISDVRQCNASIEIALSSVSPTSHKTHRLHIRAGEPAYQKVKAFLVGNNSTDNETPFLSNLAILVEDKFYNTAWLGFSTSRQYLILNQLMALEEIGSLLEEPLPELPDESETLLLSLYESRGSHEELFSLRRFPDLDTCLDFLHRQIQRGSL